jgi:exodeoxyribonuclease-5
LIALPEPSAILKQKFPFEPTAGQNQLFELMDSFINKKSANKVFIIKGYAGTGKTSIVPALVKTLPLFNYKFMLLAPTGRAAKVMSGYARRSAFTIHKIIYKQVADRATGQLRFKRINNYSKNTIFIVDESSMLSADNSFGETGVLSDLISFVFEQSNNKLILIGDTAQLPPVGQTNSAGLDADFIADLMGKNVLQVELTDVMRQQAASGILKNATYLRQQIPLKNFSIKFSVHGEQDIFKMSGDKLEDGLRYAYDKFGEQGTMVICRSNKSAVMYNTHIRTALLYRTEEIEAGDLLMIVRNNYYYVPEATPSGFLANGDYVLVTKIVSFEEIYGLRFATLELRLIDYPDMEAFEAKVILDTLHTHTPALGQEENKMLYQQVLEDYKDIKNKKELNVKLREDPYLNALQIKFAYAVTCHKSQGGQWAGVFVDQGYITEERINTDFLRWLYTAITRATDQVFLVNFEAKFFT